MNSSQPVDVLSRRQAVRLFIGAGIATALPGCVAVPRVVVAAGWWTIEQLISAVLQAAAQLAITAIADNVRQTMTAKLAPTDISLLQRGGQLFIRTRDGSEHSIAYTVETVVETLAPHRQDEPLRYQKPPAPVASEEEAVTPLPPRSNEPPSRKFEESPPTFQRITPRVVEPRPVLQITQPRQRYQPARKVQRRVVVGRRIFRYHNPRLHRTR